MVFDEVLLDRARQSWLGLAGVPVSFAGPGLDVAVAPASQLCPPGWVGIVALGDTAIGTAPSAGAAGLVREALGDRPVTDLAALAGLLPVADTLGPATLAYCTRGNLRRPGRQELEVIAGWHADVQALINAVPADEAAEAGLAGIDSPAFVLREGTRIVAAAGYRRWPGQVAHLSVLTAPDWRGCGLARVVGAAAVADALTGDLLPQWRARPRASRRVAQALGFRELGAQLSVRLRG